MVSDLQTSVEVYVGFLSSCSLFLSCTHLILKKLWPNLGSAEMRSAFQCCLAHVFSSGWETAYYARWQGVANNKSCACIYKQVIWISSHPNVEQHCPILYGLKANCIFKTPGPLSLRSGTLPDLDSFIEYVRKASTSSMVNFAVLWFYCLFLCPLLKTCSV